jgi:hypothetical protein
MVYTILKWYQLYTALYSRCPPPHSWLLQPGEYNYKKSGARQPSVLVFWNFLLPFSFTLSFLLIPPSSMPDPQGQQQPEVYCSLKGRGS